MINKLNKNKNGLSTILIVAVVVVVVVVAAVGVYWYISQNPAAPSDSATPTPGPSATIAPADISDASSLQYSVSLTENGVVQGTYTFMGKNMGTGDFSMRIDFTDADGQTIYIFNGATDKAWTYAGGEWVDISDYYAMQWDLWNNLWVGYTDGLAAWAGTGDHSYTQDGSTVRIYDIQVNPVLDDSLFTHT